MNDDSFWLNAAAAAILIGLVLFPFWLYALGRFVYLQIRQERTPSARLRVAALAPLVLAGTSVIGVVGWQYWALGSARQAERVLYSITDLAPEYTMTEPAAANGIRGCGNASTSTWGSDTSAVDPRAASAEMAQRLETDGWGNLHTHEFESFVLISAERDGSLLNYRSHFFDGRQAVYVIYCPDEEALG